MNGHSPNGQMAQGSLRSSASPIAHEIGRIAAPLNQEATSTRFCFWIPRSVLAEKTHLVWTASTIGGQQVAFYAVVDEVYRRSRKNSIDEEVDTFDGDLAFTPPFNQEGVTFAEATILGTEPPYLTAPLEESVVYLCTETEAATAYGYALMRDVVQNTDWGLPVGLLRNGGSATVGVAQIDLRDLNGDRAGHLNVTGQAGRGTKSSFLLLLVRSLIDFARRWDDGNASKPPFSVRPIVFNVKGNDLLYIDAVNRGLTGEQRELYRQMGIQPEPFTDAQFLTPCKPGNGALNRDEPRVIRPVHLERQARTYYWTLADVVRYGLWEYLFSDETQQSETMMALADHLLDLLAETCQPDADHPAGLRLRSPASGRPDSFAALREFLQAALRDRDHIVRDHGVHSFGTCRALLSRLNLVLGQEGRVIFDDGLGTGRPLAVLGPGTSDPLVIDIAGLPVELRRFVVAAVLNQIKDHQMGPRRIPGQVYFLVLDELGIYAPRGARDPITRLFEHVAAQLRSQGIILLGAQQQASKVSETIFGNSEFKVIGATSPVELESSAWNNLMKPAQKARALLLRPEEKMILVNRGWMNIVVPYPAWAMKESEVDQRATAALYAPPQLPSGRNGAGGPFLLNLPTEE